MCQGSVPTILYKEKLCDFIVWTNKDLYNARIYPDEEFWSMQIMNIEHIFITAILQELLGKFYSRTTSVQLAECSSTSSPTVTTYCYCDGPEEGSMVGCDNPSCVYQWFHLDWNQNPHRSTGIAPIVASYLLFKERLRKLTNRLVHLITIYVILYNTFNHNY